MKTAESLIKQEDSIFYGFNYEYKTAIDSKTVKKLMKAYAREAIKADRKNIIKHITIGESIDKLIINAPKIELL